MNMERELMQDSIRPVWFLFSASFLLFFFFFSIVVMRFMLWIPRVLLFYNLFCSFLIVINWKYSAIHEYALYSSIWVVSA